MCCMIQARDITPERTQKAIDRFVDDSLMRHGSLGVIVVDVKSGKTLGSRNANMACITASTMKTVTSSAALELLGIPYTGSDHLSSAMALDKTVTKIMMEAAGIPTPAWKQFVLTSEKRQQITESCKVPCVVKVTNGGSSIGVYICNTKQELKDALTQAENFHMNILVEEKIEGRELTVPILGEKALNAIEIIPPEGKTTFDYVAKYQSGEEGAREICPADISAEQQALLGKLALRLHKALGLSVYSRTDFILDRDGKPWCLEVNTLPGMTPNSLIPRAAKLEGLTYEQLCEKIVELSLNKA